MKKIEKKVNCPVCGKSVIVDDIGNGDACSQCGWVQSEMAIIFSDGAGIPNVLSLNKAKKLYEEGKPLKPDFSDFIKAYRAYGEMEFYYKNVRYGLGAPKKNILLARCDMEVPDFLEFEDLEDFITSARIDGMLLTDIWDEVENVYWLQ